MHDSQTSSRLDFLALVVLNEDKRVLGMGFRNPGPVSVRESFSANGGRGGGRERGGSKAVA